MKIPALLPIQGHEKAIKRFELFDLKSAPLLICGPESIGKKYLVLKRLAEHWQVHQATDWEKLWKNEDPRLLILTADENKKKISIDQIRRIQQEIQIGKRNFNTEWVIFIPDAENLSGDAAHAFLKTLEESNDVLFILSSSKPMQLLPTLISRCTQLHLGYLKPEEICQIIIQNEWKIPPKILEWMQRSGQLNLITPENIPLSDIQTFVENTELLEKLPMHDLFHWAYELSQKPQDLNYYLKIWMNHYADSNPKQLPFFFGFQKHLQYNVQVQLQIEYLFTQLKEGAIEYAV